ncbi:uncharacterized protein LOC115438885 [Sphaeramia orbicularis]|uniref:uncharacterized protein LOC115438885 n=1 Tax=Sphaeramia orbicularis TaxID=375764 RepID=UPI00117E04B4|nr:uncharacterized protein LOC115438885 [Sphaeramia orbicularis]
MASQIFVFYLTCLFTGKMAQVTDLQQSSSDHQKSGFILANIGDSVSLQCFFPPEGWVHWYKQTVGQKPRLISNFYYSDSVGVFDSEFQNNPRFTLDTTKEHCHLNISDLQVTDSATYFCISSRPRTVTFLESMTVHVKTSDFNIQTSVHQSESESVHPGDSVTLNCTVHTGTCDGEHSVYWFKKSEDPQPGIIYTHGGTNDQCERKNDSQTHICVYNLPILDVDYPHAGSYYCAVASCGHVLFGNGTTLNFKCDAVSVYYWSGAVVFAVLIILLGFLLYKMKKRSVSESEESQARLSAPSTTNIEDVESPHYAALTINVPNTSRRQRNITKNECVYSTVKK